MTSFEIPVVDISIPDDLVGTVRRACESIGFFCVVGHGVSRESIDRIYSTSRDFFDLPPDEKSRVGSTGDRLGGLMFFPTEQESLSASRGDRNPGDLKETLDFGPGFAGDDWPPKPSGLQQAWLDYYETMSGLARRLRGIFAEAIGLPRDHFEDVFDNHHSSLRVLHYPEPVHDPIPGQLRAGEHTDYGFLTILRSEASAGGLQAQARDGRWITVPMVADSFVVNIGDALMRWTNDQWISTLHRVVNPPTDARRGSRRQSIAFFHNPNPDAVIDPLEVYCDPDNPAKYEPISYEEYADLKYRATHGLA